MAKKLSVLVLDDDEDSLQLARCQLRDKYAIGSETTSQDAKKYLKENGVDVAIIDLALGQNSDETGIDFLKYIQNNHGNIKTIALTAHALEEDRVYRIENGFDHYIKKPYCFKDLVDAIEN